MQEYDQPVRPGDAQPAYLVMDGTMVVPGPPADVWELLLDYPSWQDYSSVETVEGAHNEVGEVVLQKKEEPGIEFFPPYYARTVRMFEHQRLVWKTFPQRRSADDPIFFGIVDFNIEPHGEDTLFTYRFFYEFVRTGEDAATAREYEAEVTASFDVLFSSIFPKLVALAAERRAATA